MDIPKKQDFTVLSYIGMGEFGTCYKVQNKFSEEIFVWKAIDYGKMTERDKERIVSEVNLLSELNHPNIVRYFGRIIDKRSSTLYIIMECCDGGDLKTRIKKCKKRNTFLEESFIWHILYQTGRAIQACHTLLPNKTVLHRDIKPANVFLDADGNVKLGDFGLARIIDGEGGLADTCVGTPFYMSPEIIKGEKYSRKSDVWSLGCLIYELCSLSPPFNGANIRELAINIQTQRLARIPQNFSEDLQGIISELLKTKPDQRPSIETIIQHPTVVSNMVNNTFHTLAKVNGKKTRKIEVVPLENEKPNQILKEHQDLHEHLVNRLESIKLRESSLRERELLIEERERAIEKREKNVTILDRLAKEKVSRAEVYLNQCRDGRSSNAAKGLTRRFSAFEPSAPDINTSLSADPGDTSILPTSTMMKPKQVARPSMFVPNLERRVHFGKLPPISKPPSAKSITSSNVRVDKHRKAFSAINEIEEVDKTADNNIRNGILAIFNGQSRVEDGPAFKVDHSMWLEGKRQAYQTTNCKRPIDANKENAANEAIANGAVRRSFIKKKQAAESKTSSLNHCR